MKIYKKIKLLLRDFYRKDIDLSMQSKLINKNFSIISQNCIGGILYHELNQQFLSPTINLWMSSSDFVKFCQDLEKNLEADLVEVKDSYKNYPVVRIDYIIINFTHYDSFVEAKKKWNERINYKNLFFIMVEKDGCTEKEIEDFSNLPYRHKLVLTCNKYKNIACAYYIPNSKNEKGEMIDLTLYLNKFSRKRHMDRIDFISFINGDIYAF